MPRKRRRNEFAKRLRAATNEGQDVAMFLKKVMNDEMESTGHRIDAAKIILDRIIGKPVTTTVLEAGEPPREPVLEQEKLEALTDEQIIEKAQEAQRLLAALSAPPAKVEE